MTKESAMPVLGPLGHLAAAFFALLAMALVACNPTPKAAVDQGTASVDARQDEAVVEPAPAEDVEIEIIAAALKKIVFFDSQPKKGDRASVVLIAESFSTRILDMPEISDEVSRELKTAFRSDDLQVRSWPPTIDVLGIQVSKPHEFAGIPDIDPRDFRSRYRYAHQAATVSRPRVSQDGNFAVVFIATGVGPLSGGSSVEIMKKDAGNWKWHKTVFSRVH